jgi:hypothetical protein
MNVQCGQSVKDRCGVQPVGKVDDILMYTEEDADPDWVVLMVARKTAGRWRR